MDTKLMMNSSAPPRKRSNIEHRVNKYIIIVFTMLFLISLISTMISIAFNTENSEAVEFFTGDSDLDTSLLNFITFMILYNNLVPISLYVTMDMVKVI